MKFAAYHIVPDSFIEFVKILILFQRHFSYSFADSFHLGKNEV